MARHVRRDEHVAIGQPRRRLHHKATDAVAPFVVRAIAAGHVNKDVEGLPGGGALDRRLPGGESLPRAVPDDVAGQVEVDRSTELVELVDAVHLKERVVRVGQCAVRLDEEHALVQTGDDLLELCAVGIIGHIRLSYPDRLRAVGRPVSKFPRPYAAFPGSLTLSRAEPNVVSAQRARSNRFTGPLTLGRIRSSTAFGLSRAQYATAANEGHGSCTCRPASLSVARPFSRRCDPSIGAPSRFRPRDQGAPRVRGNPLFGRGAPPWSRPASARQHQVTCTLTLAPSAAGTGAVTPSSAASAHIVERRTVAGVVRRNRTPAREHSGEQLAHDREA